MRDFKRTEDDVLLSIRDEVNSSLSATITRYMNQKIESGVGPKPVTTATLAGMVMYMMSIMATQEAGVKSGCGVPMDHELTRKFGKDLHSLLEVYYKSLDKVKNPK